MNGEMMPILILVSVAALLCGAMVTLSWVLGPKKTTPYKSSAYECGVEPIGTARERFPIKFYLVAMLFILFDIEVVFLWSWLTVFKNGTPEFQIFSFIEVMTYMATWILGYAYAIRVRAVDWDDTSAVDEERLGIVEADGFVGTPLELNLRPAAIAAGGGE